MENMRGEGRNSPNRPGQLALLCGFVAAVLFVCAFFIMGRQSYSLYNQKEHQALAAQMRNSMSIIDNNLRDMSRVSLIAYSDDRTQSIIKGRAQADYKTVIEGDQYMRSLFLSLITIRQEITGIFIFDPASLIFRYESYGMTLKENLSIRDFVPKGLMGQGKKLNGCTPSLVKMSDLTKRLSPINAKDDTWFLSMAREVFSFYPHQFIGHIALVSPVDLIEDTLREYISPDAMFVLLDEQGTILCDWNGDNSGISVAQAYPGLALKPMSFDAFYGCRINDENYLSLRYDSRYSGFSLVAARPQEALLRSSYQLVAISVGAILVAIALLGALSYMIVSLQAMEIHNRQTELSMLRSQINAHFLYNTLDTIRMKALMNGDTDVSSLIMKLVSFFRLSVGNDKRIVPLRHEIELIEVYMQLMRSRYPDIGFVLDVQEDTLDAQVPSFILQPLVENSILHGLKPQRYCGTITLSTRYDGPHRTKLTVSICDSGVGMSPEVLDALNAGLSPSGTEDSAGRSHVGVCNVRQRLHRHYGDSCSMLFRANPGPGVTVLIDVYHSKRKGRGRNP